MTDALGNVTGFEPIIPPFDEKADDGLIVPAGMKTDADIEREINKAGSTAEPITPRLMTPSNPTGAEPRKGMGFKENAVGSFKSGTPEGAVYEAGQIRQVRTFNEGGIPRPQAEAPAAFPPDSAAARLGAVKPVLREGEADRIADTEDAIINQLAYDFSPANLSVASVAGTLVGNLPSVTNLGGLSGAITKAFPSMGGRAIALPAADAALTNTLADPIIQGIRMGSGAQQNYELEQTLLAPVMGAAIGGAIGGAALGIGRFRDWRTAQRAGEATPDVPAAVSPQVDAPRAAASTFDAEIARAMDEAFPETVKPEAAPATRAVETQAPPAAKPVEAPETFATPVEKSPVEPPRNLAAENTRREISREITAEAPPALLGPEPPRLQAHTVSTATGRQVDVAPVVVEASSLRASSDPGFPPEMQPRDRSRAASDAQVREIAANLTPERLGVSTEADRGAPIVGPDGAVESGNGRLMAIRAAYAQGGESAAKYRAWIEGLGVDTKGMKEPVIVRQRLGTMTMDERRAFAVEANQSATLSMSAPERALADAQRLTPDTLSLIRSDDFAAAGNRDFMRAFAQSLPSTERAAFMTADGSVSTEGVMRARNAVLARAYGDSPVLARITESADDDAKSISNALVAVAPEWAKLRAEIEAGAVRADMEMTAQLIEAVRRTIDIRARNGTLDSFLRQQDAFDQVDPSVVAWMEMLYRSDRKRAAGKDAIVERIGYYAQEARKATAGEGLFSDLPPVRAADLMDAAAKRGSRDASAGQQGDLLTSGPARAGAGDAPRSGEGGGRKAGAGSGQAESSRAGSRADGPAAEPARGRNDGSPASANRRDDGPPARSPEAGAGDAGRLDPDVLAMASRKGGTSTAPGGDRRFAVRGELKGEASKPKALPKDIKPEEIKSFRITEAIRELAADLGLKVEVDGRFSIRGALGTYGRKSGVIRLRHEGDMEVFAHEFGHAVDFRLKADKALGKEWDALIKQHAAELKPLDANTSDPTKQTAIEGVAEFLRMYVNNPAYARQKAPGFAAAMDAWLPLNAPEIKAALDKAARFSQIDSGLSPTQAMESMISNDLTRMTGAAYTFEYAKRNGIPATMRMLVTEGSAKFFGSDAYIKAMMSDLAEAHFQLTGKPLERLWRKDPYKNYRLLPNAGASSAQILANGVRAYGRETDGPLTRGLAEILRDAYQGEPFQSNGPVATAFRGYLIARRSLSLYDQWRAGDRERPPIRLSEGETRAAVAQYEAQHPHFRQHAEELYAFSTAYLERYRDAGFLKPEQFESIVGKSRDYVPFARDREGELISGPSASLEKSAIKGFRGSTRDIIDPFDSLIRNVIAMENQIFQNRFTLSLRDMADRAGPQGGRHVERIPNSELTGVQIDLEQALRSAAKKAGADEASTELLIRQADELFDGDMLTKIFKSTDTTTKGERILFGWEGGERFALKLGDNFMARGLFDALENMSPNQWDMVFATLGRFNGFFSQMVTNAPSFGLKNLVMDAQTRGPLARDAGVLGRIPGYAHLRGALSMVFDKEFAESFNMLGGIRGGVVSSFTRDLQNAKPSYHIDTIIPETAGDKIGFAMAILRDPKRWPTAPFHYAKFAVKTPFEALIKFAEGTETAGRIGQAKIVGEHLRKQGATKEDAAFGAVFEAVDVLDYGRKGLWLKQVSSVWSFFNAGMQGLSTANRRLIYDPSSGLWQAYRRGGFANLDKEKMAQLSDAAMNWTMIAAVAVPLTAWYYDMVKDDPEYQKLTPYMKRRYFWLPLPGGYVFALPKPFDLPGSIISATEASLDYAYRRDPKALDNIGNSLEDAFIPRQLGGLGEMTASAMVGNVDGAKDGAWKLVQNIAGANPLLKTGAEAVIGRTLGFEGQEGFPIVPERLQGLPPEDQVTDRTQWIEKKLGQVFDVAPVKIGHILQGLGATAYRDASRVVTSLMEPNGNYSPSEAISMAFVGAMYRRSSETGNAFTSDIMKLMAQANGKYMAQATGFSERDRRGDREGAEVIYNRANDTAKALITLMSNSRQFSSEARQLHPLVRAQTLHAVLSEFRTELAEGDLKVKGQNEDNKAFRRGDKLASIDVPPADARTIGRMISSLQIEEGRNGLAIAKEPGYQNFPIIDVSGRYEAIKAVSPEAAKELQRRLEKAHVLPAQVVADRWPDVQAELLENRGRARLDTYLRDASRASRRRQSAQR